MNAFKIRALAALLALAALPALAGAPKNIEAGEGPPERLSDLYKLLTLNLRKGLGPDLVAWPIRLTGRSQEIVDNGMFYELEMTLKPFEMQGLNFEKGEIFIKKMSVDREALQHWDIKVLDYREVQTRLIFTLRSLEKKLSLASGQELKLRADSAERTLGLIGRGRFCGIPVAAEATAGLRWDEKGRKLYLEPKAMRFGGFQVPRLLWWLGSSPLPEAAILDLSGTWVPLNIQEIYVGWDRINLSTNW
jgi:hypothetical protein